MKSQGAPPRRSCYMAHLQARGHRQENCVFGETTGILLEIAIYFCQVGKGITYDTGGADIKAGGVMAGKVVCQMLKGAYFSTLLLCTNFIGCS